MRRHPGLVGLAALAALAAGVAPGRAAAQPKDAPPSDPPKDAVEIEMAPEPPTAPTAPTAPTGKDPKLAKKWLAAGQQLMQKGSNLASRKRPDDARPQFENAVTAFQKAIDAGDD